MERVNRERNARQLTYRPEYGGLNPAAHQDIDNTRNCPAWSDASGELKSNERTENGTSISLTLTEDWRCQPIKICILCDALSSSDQNFREKILNGIHGPVLLERTAQQLMG